jgi:predicted dehydrogenase
MSTTTWSPVRLAMIGGGEGAFIGAVHRLAARLDGAYTLVAGAFSRDHANSLRTGSALGIEPARCYASWEALLAGEAALPQARRTECIAIVTPNHLHLPVAAAALRAGFHVISDKPATRTLAEAEALVPIVRDSGRLYGLTHTYLGYPMVAEMRDRIAQGALGALRKIYVEYPQGWLSADLEHKGNKQAAWRSDPAQAGSGGAIGDIGTHAFTLAEWVTQHRVTALAADLRTHVAGRALDDDAAALLRFEGGASGVLTCSQVCAGEENALTLRVYGERGGMEWRQMEPNSLVLRPVDAPMQILRAGAGGALGELALSRCRTPGGHPEGYVEAFANLYRDFAAAIRAGETGTARNVPGIELGVRGMRFVERMVESAHASWKWTAFENGGEAR